MAETVTVKHSSGHGQQTSVKVGTEFNLKVSDPRKGPSAGVSVSGGLGSGHGTGTAVQGQAKTAVIHGGPQRRYQTVIRVEGQIHSDLRGHRVEDFTADLTGELLVPESQLPEADPANPAPRDVFETALADAPREPAPTRRATLNRDAVHRENDGALNLATRFGTATGLTKADTWLARNHPKTYLRLRKLEAGFTRPNSGLREPFPRGGLADDAALVRHLRRLDGPVELHLRPDYELTPARLETLLRLQQSGKAALFRVSDDPNLAPYRILIHETRQEPTVPLPPEGANPGGTAPHEDIQLQAPNEPRLRVTAFTGPEQQYSSRHGYVLDQHGVRHGWSGDVGAPNPAHPNHDPQGPATVRAPRTRTISDLRNPARNAEENPPRVAVVVSAHRSESLAAEVTEVRDALGDRMVERTSPYGVLTTEGEHRPDTGYVVNPAGKVVWGWERAPDEVPQWGPNAESGKETLVAMMRQAGKTGLQIVVDPGSRFAQEFRTAVTQLHADDVLNGNPPNRKYENLLTRWDRTRKNHGEELPLLDKDQLLRMLVSDPNVRIVDEHGVVQNDLNARGVVQRRPTAVDTSHRLREEYAIHNDGTVLRSVSWRRDPVGDGDLVVGHVRRAVHESDPRQETPDMVSGTGLGSAALKELPGAQHIHGTVRSLITKMIDNDHGAGRHGDRPGDAAAARRHAKASAQLRFELDKQLQLTFGTPKLRGARGRGFDSGLQEEFSFRGRKYQVTVEQVLLRRDPGTIDTETGLAIDHQVKGSRGASTSVTRSGHVTLEGGGGARFELPGDEVALDLGDTGISLSGSMQTTRSLNSTAKNQSRLRAPNGVASRPEYEARYQVTVTESTRRVLGGTRDRVASRIIDQDPVTVPAIVHSAFRPDAERAGDAAYRAAYHDVVSTLGRTTELTGTEFDNLFRSEHRYDFSSSGTDGLHATFSGLKGAVAAATNLVLDHAFGTDPSRRAPAEGPQTHPAHPAYVAEVERALSEGFLRSNLPRLLGEGIPVPLPKEHHWGAGLPNANHSLTVRGYLVKGDPGAGHAAPRATVESYVEHDVKVSTSKNKSFTFDGHTDFGPAITLGVTTENKEGGGDGTTPPSESAARRRTPSGRSTTRSAGTSASRPAGRCTARPSTAPGAASTSPC
ncbi:hypothetical protein ACFQ9X_33930 [Catenulispora yoronensis]